MDERLKAQDKIFEISQDYVGWMFRHFKGNYYKVIKLGVHSETSEILVIYEDDHHNVWVRPYEMFISDVDHEKYPDATQEKRFEKV